MEIGPESLFSQGNTLPAAEPLLEAPQPDMQLNGEFSPIELAPDAGAIALLGATHEQVSAVKDDKLVPPVENAEPRKPAPVHTDRSGRKKKGAVKKPKGGKGHFSKQIKSQLTQSGKINANKPMSEEQKRARRRKRKK